MSEVAGRQLRKSTLQLRQVSEPRTIPSQQSKESKPRAERSERNGKSRRTLFKKKPQKAALYPAGTVTSKLITHKGVVIRVGDIVAVQGQKDELVYAQITGLLTDAYNEKSASLAWLTPTQVVNLGEKFVPESYEIAIYDDLPRNLECMYFVQHLPPDFYRTRISNLN